MAVAFTIPGKVTLITGSSTVVGYTSAEEMIEVEEMIHVRKVTSTEGGPNLERISLNLGRSGRITCPLNQWDEVQVDLLRIAKGATLSGQIGTLGGINTYFSMTVQPTIAGAFTYVFAKCRLVDTIRLGPWGVQEQIMNLIFEALPDPTLLGTPTTPWFVKTVIA